jgi:hypothetical protein
MFNERGKYALKRPLIIIIGAFQAAIAQKVLGK